MFNCNLCYQHIRKRQRYTRQAELIEHASSVDTKIRILCSRLDLSPRSVHKLRKQFISFHSRDEAITANAAFDFGKEFAEKWFPEHQTLVSVHQDREHIHIHLVTNTVSFVDGHKLHNTRNDLERMKEFTNRMCQDRALSIAEKGKHFDGTRLEEGEIIAWSKDKYHLVKNEEKNSFVADCAIAILDIVDHCTSREAFITGMKEKGWDVIWTDSKKHITFCDSEGHKVRDTNLSKSFTLEITKEALNGKFERQNELRTYRTESGAENRADPSKTGTVRHGSRQQPPSENRKNIRELSLSLNSLQLQNRELRQSMAGLQKKVLCLQKENSRMKDDNRKQHRKLWLTVLVTLGIILIALISWNSFFVNTH